MTKINFLILGLLLGTVLSYVLFSESTISGESNSSQEKQPLYWVAPMDSNYRRDQPGLSPMGMALIPVYDESHVSPGVVTIAPHVVNNLGVTTTSINKQPLVRNIRTVGYIQYDENLLGHVHPRVSGWVHELYVKSDGVQVKQGDPLFALYSPELINAQEEYLLALSRQQANLIQATEARLKSLQIDKQTINRIKTTRTAQQNVVFYAPQDGVVSNLHIREGFYLQPGTEVMTLADLSSVWLEIELTEQQLPWVVIGDQVNMQTAAIPGKQFTGVVDFIYPFLDPNSKTAQVRLTFPNPQQWLKPHMVADVSIKPQQHDVVLTVPRSAVIRTGTQDRVVWALGSGEFKSVVVKLGRFNAEYFEVLSGLQAGDEVVTSAQFLIDSESHKTSDLKRFTTGAKAHAVSTARVWGEIKAINGQVITIHREAIEQWNRPATTMDFTYTESTAALETGQTIDFTFAVQQDAFVITEIHAVNQERVNDQ